MNKRKLTNDELRDLLLENCQDENGNLVICGIDLSEFKGNVILNGWTVGGSVDLSSWNIKGNLFQNCQTAENIYQGYQIVNGDIYQSCQRAKNIYQSYQTAENLEQKKLMEK